MPKTRVLILHLARALGFFRLARWFTRGQARILCYHGYAYQDEHRFSPQLFMHPDTFKRRVQTISNAGLKPVSLNTLVEHLEQGKPIAGMLVITVDDGWSGFARFAWPALREAGLPCTLYLTTWYLLKELPVLNVLRRYLVWLGASLPSENDDPQEELAQLLSAAQQQGINLRCEDGLLFQLSTLSEVCGMADQGLDLQLHTHRHRLPSDPTALQAELESNRAVIDEAAQKKAQHLCYPSGEYNTDQIPLLRQAGVRSATTTQLGLVRQDTDLWQLPRLLDDDDLHDIELEAELTGFATLVRRALGRGKAKPYAQKMNPR